MNQQPTIILASASAIRRQLLSAAGLQFRVMPPEVDEAALKRHHRGAEPLQLVQNLAAAKATAVSRGAPASLTIGADQILVFEGEVFDKATSIPEAKSHLRRLRGKSHTLISTVCCAIAGKATWTFTGRAELTMRNFSDVFLDAYAEATGPDLLASVGAYKLEARGIQLFSKMEGDYFTILGLPLLPLLGYLRETDIIPT